MKCIYQILRIFLRRPHEALEKPAPYIPLERSDILKDYSEGRIATKTAVSALGMRSSADLLVALGDAGLLIPMPPEEEIETQANLIAGIWNKS